MKRILLVILILHVFPVLAQTPIGISIDTKDQHYSSYTSATVSKDGSFFMTADETGKIIRTDVKSIGTTQTVRKSSGIPVTWMKLVKNDSILLFSQKIKYGNPATDSLFFYSMHNAKISKIQSVSVFTDNSPKGTLACKTVDNYTTTLSLFNEAFHTIGTVSTMEHVDFFTVSSNRQKFAYTEGDLMAQQKVTVSSINGNFVSFALRPEQQVIHMYFDESSTELYLICILESEQSLAVFKTEGDKIGDQPLFKVNLNAYKHSTKVNDRIIDGRHNMIITSSMHGTRPLMLSGSGDKFTSTIIEIDNASELALSIPQENEILFFKSFNPAFDDVPGFYVYNLQKRKVSGEYPTVSSGFYKGAFLPGSNWVLTGSRHDQGIKYFTNGTFDNRFAKVKFKDYLELNHSLTSLSMHLDRKSGNYIVQGYIDGKAGTGVGYFRYDLISDVVHPIISDAGLFFHVADYKNDDADDLLLLFGQEYTSQDTGPGYPLTLIKGNSANEIPGLFKDAKLSGNSTLLLTISGSNLLKISDVKSGVEHFSKQLDPGNYQVFDAGPDEFIIEVQYFSRNNRDCYNETMLLTYTDGVITPEIQQCMTVNDVTFHHDTMAMIVNNSAVVVKNKTLLFTGGESPQTVSFNHDASLFMVSFRNGKIVLYDTETTNQVGTMIHPDGDSHIFFDSNGHYFSNIDATPYLKAMKNGKSVSLKAIEKEAFRPDKVLEIFGVPDAAYQEVLAKATKLRQDQISRSETNSTEKNTNPASQRIDSNAKPELYIVSIGVSDYRQSAFNLTFADKDALDMARIYGQLDNNTLLNYRNKFFGHNFNLLKQNGIAGNLKRYQPAYMSFKQFNPVGEDVWVEILDGKANIWNFAKQSTDSINFPKEFSPYGWGAKNVYGYNNGKNFSVMGSDNKVLAYDLQSRRSNVVNIPADMNLQDFRPVSDREWIFLSYESGFDYSNKIKITTLNPGSGKVSGSKSVTINGYKTSGTETTEQKTDFSQSMIFNFYQLSENGKYLTFTVSDDAVFVLPLDGSEPTKFAVGSSKYDDVSVSNDGRSVALLGSDDQHYKCSVHTIGKPTVVQEVPSANVRGFSILNAVPSWVEQQEPLLEHDYSARASDDLLDKEFPSSFSKVHMAHLVNQKATSSEVKKLFDAFFKKSKPQDQIMIFLAGHGVLDSDKNYFYAPHDMDFNKVMENGIAFDYIINSLKNAPAVNKLLLMDSCHSGSTLDQEASNGSAAHVPSAGKRGSGATSTEEAKFKLSDAVTTLFDNFLSTSGVTVISAASGADVAYETKDLGNGAFTSAYLTLLKQKLSSSIIMSHDDLKKTVTMDQSIITELFKQVMQLTQSKQVPDLREVNENAMLFMW